MSSSPGPSDRHAHAAARDRAYLRLTGWFVLAMFALGLYFWLAMLNVTLAAIWPLLAVVCAGIFKCGTVKP